MWPVHLQAAHPAGDQQSAAMCSASPCLQQRWLRRRSSLAAVVRHSIGCGSASGDDGTAPWLGQVRPLRSRSSARLRGAIGQRQGGAARNPPVAIRRFRPGSRQSPQCSISGPATRRREIITRAWWRGAATGHRVPQHPGDQLFLDAGDRRTIAQAPAERRRHVHRHQPGDRAAADAKPW
jgi:hypothetical protein